MLSAHPLHVQQCSSSLFPDTGCVIRGRNDSAVREERRVWNYAVVLPDLRLRFFRFRDGAERLGDVPERSAFFTLPCVNAGAVMRKDGDKVGVLTTLQRETVLESSMSYRTAYPHVEGSQSANASELLSLSHLGSSLAAAAEAEEGTRQKLCVERQCDGFSTRNASWLSYLSLSLSLPTVAALVRCGAGSRLMLLLLRPHVHAGKSASLGYRATLAPMSDISRRLSVSPCGTSVLAVPERFVVVEDPLRACEASTPVLTGEVVSVAGNEVGSPVPFHVLSGEMAASSRRMERLLGTALTWVQCRLSGVPGSAMEVVLVSQRGMALVCVAGGVAGGSLCGVRFRCVRCVRCATTPLAGSGAGLPLPWQCSRPVEEAVAVRCHVRRQRVVGSSGDGLVLLCVPESVPDEMTVVLTSAQVSSCRLPCAPTSVRLPTNFELHDAHVVSHPGFSGALVVGVTRGCGGSASVLRGPETECPVQLHFVPFGGSETTPVSLSSFRCWSELPAAFLGPASRLRLVSVEVVSDPAGTPALLVALASSGYAKAVATVLLAVPSAGSQLRESLLRGPATAERVFGLAVAVEMHVARTIANLCLRDEWARRQRHGTGCVPRCLEMSAERAVELPVQVRCPADCGSEASLCGLEEDCVEVLRVELVEAQRAGSDVNAGVSFLCALVAGVQRGVDAVGAAAATAAGWAVVPHLRYFQALAGVLLSAVEVLEMAGAASAVVAAAALLEPRREDVRDVALGWPGLLKPVFDAALAATAGAPVSTAPLRPLCSGAVQSAVRRGREWLQAEEERRCLTIAGTSYPMLTLRSHADGVRPVEKVVECVAAGPAHWEQLSVLDIYWASRVLFLSKGPTAAVQLLKTLCSGASCAPSVQQLHEMYSGIEARNAAICERFGLPRA